MKGKRSLTLLAALLFLLTGCSSTQEPEVSYEEPVYQFDTVTVQDEICAEDGRKLMEYSYQFLAMSVTNADKLSPEEQTLTETAVRNFNERMEQYMKEAEEFGRSCGEGAKDAYAQGFFTHEYTDEAVSGGYLCGDIVSVWIESYSYLGGAHGNSGTSSCIFDLSLGRFVDPLQAFRTGAAQLLIAKAEADAVNLPEYWSDYRDIISRWSDGTVIFDKTGMIVIYSPYEIGPFSMGTVELPLSYDDLAPLLGESGLQRLGVTASE